MPFSAPKEDVASGGFSAPKDDIVPGNSVLDKFSGALNSYKDSPLYKASPVGMLNKASDLMYKGFNKAGEVTAEKIATTRNPLTKTKFSPETAASVGTAVQMAPDLAMALSPQKLEVGAGAAKSLVRRGLGFTKAGLKTPFARGQAAKAAEVALENNIVPSGGSAQVAFDRASDLASKTGKKIGETLDNIDFYKIAPEAEKDLELLRSNLTKGTDKGLLAGANQVIDKIKTTIVDLYGRDATAKTYNQAKNVLSNSLNYLADLSSQGLNKKVVNSMSNTIRQRVKDLVPGSYLEFVNNQRLYNAAESMKKALNPEIAAQMGNNITSPTGTIVAATQLAGGNVPGAITSLGAVELLKRRGNLAIGKQFHNLAKSRVSSTPNALMAISRKFSESKKKENQ